jgi:hypothetical protein
MTPHLDLIQGLQNNTSGTQHICGIAKDTELNTKKYHTGLCIWYFITLTLNFCSSVLDIVSALAIIGMILTFVSSFFIQTRSIDFKLEKEKLHISTGSNHHI